MKLCLNKKLDKNKILSMMQCYRGSSFYDEYSLIFDELITNESLDDVFGYYVIEDNVENNMIYDEKIYCIVLLSEKFDLVVDDFFLKSDLIRGLLMSTIGDYILFKASDELSCIVKEDCNKRGYNLSKKHEPGTGDIDMIMQTIILDKIKKEHDIQIDVTSGYMYTLKKALGFYYEASSDFIECPIEHDCSKCDNVSCQYRNIL